MKDIRTNLLQVLSVFATGVDDQSDVENSHDDDRHIDRLVLDKVGIGEYIVPIDRCWQDQKATGERGQMCREALCLSLICQRSHLERKVVMGNRHFDNSPANPRIAIAGSDRNSSSQR